MPLFDVRTAYLVVGILYLVMPVLAWLVLAGNRTTAVKLWVGSCAVGGFATLLFAFRGIAPDWATMTLASSSLVVASLLAIMALRIELGEPLPWSLMAKGVLVFILGFELFRVVLAQPGLRALYAGLTQALLLACIPWLALRLARKEGIRSPYWITGTYLLLLGAMIYRVASIALGQGTPTLVEAGNQTSLDSVLLPLAGVLTSVISQIAYVGIVLERSTRERLAMARTEARLQENHRVSERLSHLDRQRCLDEMSVALGRELHHPLVSIRRWVRETVDDLVTSDPADAHAQARASQEIGRIIEQIRRASATIEKIRGFIRPGRFDPVPVDLGRIARDLLPLIDGTAASNQVSIGFHIPERPMWVKGDATLLSQALLHIYRNAIQAMATSERREFLVHASQIGDSIAISVCDTGPGLQPGMEQRISSPFVSGTTEGLGLGLSITRSIIDLHGGRLSFSPALGGGLSVDIELPALAESDARPSVEPAGARP